MDKTWEPSLPKGLPRDTPLTTEPGTTGLPFEHTPAGSHVAGFRHYDARKYSFLRKFGEDATRGMSQIHVRFRDVTTGRLVSEYWYYFSRHDVAVQLFGQLKGSAYPGTLIPDLEAGCDRYQKQAQFSAG